MQWDGVYLDLDVLLVKPLDGLEPNFAPRENDYYVSNSVLALSSDIVGRSIAKELYRYDEIFCTIYYKWAKRCYVHPTVISGPTLWTYKR